MIAHLIEAEMSLRQLDAPQYNSQDFVRVLLLLLQMLLCLVQDFSSAQIVLKLDQHFPVGHADEPV